MTMSNLWFFYDLELDYWFKLSVQVYQQNDNKTQYGGYHGNGTAGNPSNQYNMLSVSGV